MKKRHTHTFSLLIKSNLYKSDTTIHAFAYDSDLIFLEKWCKAKQQQKLRYH